MLLIAIVVLLLIACSGDEPPAQPNDASPTAAPTTEATRPPAASPGPGGGVVNNEPVAFMTDDGVTLRGHLYSAPGPKRKVLLIASHVPQSTWQVHANELNGAGIALFTFDTRGRGETGGAVNEALMAADVELAVRYLKSRDYPQVYLLGVGEQASPAVLTIAATHDVAGVAVLPPGRTSVQEMAQVSEPKLLMVTEGDSEGLQNLYRLLPAATGAKDLVFPLPPAPTNDVLSIPFLKQAVLDFLAR